MSPAPDKGGTRPLRVLILEDSPDDATLTARSLTTAGFELDVDLATGRERFAELLAGQAYDVILADFSLPGFDAHAALEMAQAACPTTPFVCVSGTIGEEATVELLKHGAADCVLKDRLARLPFAVERAIAEARHRTVLRESESRYRDLAEATSAIVWSMHADGSVDEPVAAWAEFTGQDPAAITGDGWAEAVHPDDREVAFAAWAEAMTERRMADSIYRLRRHDGVYRWMHLRAVPRFDADGELFEWVATLSDITERKRAEEALEHSAAVLSNGERLAHLGSWEWDVAAGVAAVSEEWQRLHGLTGERFTDEEVLALCHPDDREAVQAAAARAVAGEPYRVDHRIVLPKTREVRHLMTYGEPRYDAQGRVEAVIGASLDVTERVRTDEALREREERLQRALADTVAALGATVAMRDPYTSAHERRVAELATRIATRLGWSVEAVERLRIAALVHDIGKITIPAEILSKPSRLTETEFALIKSHSAAAYEILAPIDFGGPVAEIVLQHHERLDGSGYPQGLSGDQILPGARLLAVADVVEAMVTHRPYRPALPFEQALAEIEGGAGTRYDAGACAAAVRLFRDEGFALSK